MNDMGPKWDVTGERTARAIANNPRDISHRRWFRLYTNAWPILAAILIFLILIGHA